MNTPEQLRFDYAALDTDTRIFVQERAERIHNLARMTAAGIVQIGQYLTEVKERLKHGKFLEWIEREFGWSQPSAWRFMNVHEQFKLSNLNNLQIDVSALYLIAAPKTPEPVRSQIIARAENGERVTFSGTRAVVQHFAQTGEMPDIEVSLPELIEQRRPTEARSGSYPGFSYEDNQKMGRAERAAAAQLERECDENTRRNAALMSMIVSIKTIADSSVSVQDIAAHINRYDTVDQGWRGKVREAQLRLKHLISELKI
jgi:hypothetical protein